MDWATITIVVFANLGVMIPLFLWNRSEANADRREFSSKMDAFKDLWAQETKDFHARLFSIEERNRK